MPAAASTPRKSGRYRPEKNSKKQRTEITPMSPETVTPVKHGNTKGLPTLPVELHLEIISYLPSVPIPCPTSGILPGKYRDKFDTLFALSQTCSALYHVYYPLVWRSLEICATRCEPRMTRVLGQHMATELVSQIEVVTIRAPHLAEFVQVFNVALTAFSSPTVYKEFVRCLHCLPNLHTLQIISFPECTDDLAPQKALQSLARAFAQASLPSVKTLTVPVELLKPMRLAKTFPNLQHLAILDWKQKTGYTNVLQLIPRSIYSLHGFPQILNLLLPSTQHYCTAYHSLIESVPHLRITPQLSFQYASRFPTDRGTYFKGLRTSLLSWMHKFPELHTIQLLAYVGFPNAISIEAVVEVVKDVLVHHLQAHEDIVEGRINLCHLHEAYPYRVVKVRRPSTD